MKRYSVLSLLFFLCCRVVLSQQTILTEQQKNDIQELIRQYKDCSKLSDEEHIKTFRVIFESNAIICNDAVSNQEISDISCDGYINFIKETFNGGLSINLSGIEIVNELTKDNLAKVNLTKNIQAFDRNDNSIAKSVTITFYINPATKKIIKTEYYKPTKKIIIHVINKNDQLSVSDALIELKYNDTIQKRITDRSGMVMFSGIIDVKDISLTAKREGFLPFMLKGNLMDSLTVALIPQKKDTTFAIESPDKKYEIGLFFSFAISSVKISEKIKNSETYIADVTGKNKFAINPRLEFCNYVNVTKNKKNKIGIGIGIGSSTYKTVFSVNEYKDTTNTVDKNNESYRFIVVGKDITESVELNYIDIPVFLKYKFDTEKLSVFLIAGYFFSYNKLHNFSSAGTYTYKGFYPQYNIEFTDMPEYGYYSNVKTENQNSLQLKTMSYSVYLECGILIKIYNNLNVNVSGSFVGFNNLSENKSSIFKLSSHLNNYNSLLNSGKKVTSEIVGGNIGLVYKF